MTTTISPLEHNSKHPYLGPEASDAAKMMSPTPVAPPNWMESIRSARSTRDELKRSEYVSLVRRLALDHCPSPEEVITILDATDFDEHRLQHDVDMAKQWYRDIITATEIGDHIEAYHDAQAETLTQHLAVVRQERQAHLARVVFSSLSAAESAVSDRERQARLSTNALSAEPIAPLLTQDELSLVDRFREASDAFKLAVSTLADAEQRHVRSTHEAAAAEIEKQLAELVNDTKQADDWTQHAEKHQKDASAAAKEIKTHEKAVKTARTALDHAVEQLRKATTPKDSE
jgi:hypothetical protein